MIATIGLYARYILSRLLSLHIFRQNSTNTYWLRHQDRLPNQIFCSIKIMFEQATRVRILVLCLKGRTIILQQKMNKNGVI